MLFSSKGQGDPTKAELSPKPVPPKEVCTRWREGALCLMAVSRTATSAYHLCVDLFYPQLGEGDGKTRKGDKPWLLLNFHFW